MKKKALHLLCTSALSLAIANTTWAQVDSDNDGVINDYDQCAGTPAGTVVNPKAEVALLLDINWSAPTYAGSITSTDWGGLDQSSDLWAVKLVLDDFDLDTDGTVSESSGEIAIDIDSSTSLPVGVSPANGHTGLASSDYAVKSSAAQIALFDAFRLEDNVRGTANYYPGYAWSFTRRMHDILPEGADLKENDIIDALMTTETISVSERFHKTSTAEHQKLGTATVVAASFVNAGCEPFTDSDSDGVVDGIDQCPSSTPGAAVNQAGCETIIDSDGDGVPDDRDLCPDSESISVDADGCAIVFSSMIEAEDYDASHDLTSGNTGGEYRSDDTDIQETTDSNGGYNVGWIDAGEWLEYNVSLSAATYDVMTRVASAINSGAYEIYLDGQLVGSDNISSTGGWQSWTTQKAGTVSVSSGDHTLRVVATGNGFNLNWIEFAAAAVEVDGDNDGVSDSNDQCADTPAGETVDANGCSDAQNSGGNNGGNNGGSTTPTLVTQIEAEDYSYQDDVQTETTSDENGGLNVGWIDAGDWLSYHSVNIPETGTYLVEYRVASNGGGASLKLEQSGGGSVYGTVSVPHTGGWQNWETVSHTVELQGGMQDLAIVALESGWNINWIKIYRVE